jgi:hypothetical protein
VIYRYNTTVMSRTPGIHEHRLPYEGYASENQMSKKKFFYAPPGGGKSLGQKVLRPQPQSFHASVKNQGGGYSD